MPLPALWTAVLGEYNREEETGHEQRIPVEKVFIHDKYQHFTNDLAMLKLSRPAFISVESQVGKICLPFTNEGNCLGFVDDINSKENSHDFSMNDNYLDIARRGKSIKTARHYIAKYIIGDNKSKVSWSRKNNKFSQGFLTDRIQHSAETVIIKVCFHVIFPILFLLVAYITILHIESVLTRGFGWMR